MNINWDKVKHKSIIVLEEIIKILIWVIKRFFKIARVAYASYLEVKEERLKQRRKVAVIQTAISKKHAEEQAKIEEENRIIAEKEAKKQAIIDKKQAIIDKENRIKAEKEAIKKRNARHENLCKTLQDPLEVLETDLGIFFVNNSHQVIPRLFMDMAQQGLEAKLSDNVFNSKEEMAKVLNMGAYHAVLRTVADLNEKEIGILKLISFFNKVQLISDKDYAYTELWISYNDGNSSLSTKSSTINCTDKVDRALGEFIPCWLKANAKPPALVVNEAIALIGRARKEVDDPKLTAIIEKELKGAAGWMKTSSI